MLLEAEGVEAQALVRVLEVAAEQHQRFLDSFFSNIEACVQNGVAKAFKA
ncbi:MAG TPA: hypothetical protein VFT75_18265 [Nocardioidaceae bacterium]|nr:hypothetical protein [Nocardioidaceae bacterium]